MNDNAQGKAERKKIIRIPRRDYRQKDSLEDPQRKAAGRKTIDKNPGNRLEAAL